MTKKSFITLGALTLVGIAGVVALPIALTSCSDNTKTNQTVQPNQDIQVSINQSNSNPSVGQEGFITLSASVSLKNNSNSQNNNFGYQWYYKKKSSTSFLEFNSNLVQGFTVIKNATQSSLKINTKLYPVTKLQNYDFICVAYELTNPNNYNLSNVFTISSKPEQQTPPSSDSNNGNGTGNHQPTPPKPPVSKPENNQPNNGGQQGNGSQSNPPNSAQVQNNVQGTVSKNEYGINFINLDFSKINNETILVQDSALEQSFKQNMNNVVDLASTNVLYQAIAKQVDPNYQTNKSLSDQMTCVIQVNDGEKGW